MTDTEIEYPSNDLALRQLEGIIKSTYMNLAERASLINPHWRSSYRGVVYCREEITKHLDLYQDKYLIIDGDSVEVIVNDEIEEKDAGDGTVTSDVWIRFLEVVT